MVRAWPVKARTLPTLLERTYPVASWIRYVFDTKTGDATYTYTPPDAKTTELNLQWMPPKGVWRLNKKAHVGVLNRDLLLVQSEQDHHLWHADGVHGASPARSKKGSPSPAAKGGDLTADSVYFDGYVSRVVTLDEALRALDSLNLFSVVNARSCLLFNALPAVLRENKSLIEAKRGGYFGSFVLSGDYIEQNASARHMVPFWQNLYYQFGLLAVHLHCGVLRPPNSKFWSTQCRIVSAFGSNNLYADAKDFGNRGRRGLETYRDNYNTRHGTLRWFRDTLDNTSLHIDITNLTPIVTTYFARHIEKSRDRVQYALLSEVFRLEIEGENTVEHIGQELENAVKHKDYQTCSSRDAPTYKKNEDMWYDAAFEWTWNVHKDKVQVYDNIYEEARKRSANVSGKEAKCMSYIQAVEHYRRYSQRKGPSIFWSAA